MVWVWRILGAIVVSFLALFVAQIVASESGEVVVLHHVNDAGEEAQTRLWVVDQDGVQWLRTGSELAGWYKDLLARPEVKVVRGETTTVVTARPNPAQRDAINDLMAAKYGWADQLIDVLYGREDAIPIELVVP